MEVVCLDSRALAKIQAVVLIVVIFVAVVIGSGAYFLWSGTLESAETIKIGICADLDMTRGESIMNGAILAAEEINAQGGVLGRQIEIVGEDSDIEAGTLDTSIAIAALTRLITFHKVDFVIAGGGEDYLIETAVEHKKILLGTLSPSDSLTQMVIDDYDRYKYFFRLGVNGTASYVEVADSLAYVREITGFSKVAYIALDVPQVKVITEGLDYLLPEVYGFDLVYTGVYPWGTVDFSSYFAAAEANGAEIVIPIMVGQEGVAFVKEWYERQSPMVVWGVNSVGSGDLQSWNWTEGKCEHTVAGLSAVQLGYPVTSKTLSTREAYLNRWGTLPSLSAIVAYDCIRFLLYDALQRAQTTETEAVIEALEESEVENSLEENFKFTSNHDHSFGEDNKAITIMYQWQAGGAMAIVYPKEIMEETGATYTYPDWPGAWD